MNRNRLPRWVNHWIDRIADAPMSPIGRIAARRLGAPAPRGSVPTTAFEEHPTRLLIAPVNYSGQGTAWARALERADSGISARNLAIDVPGGFCFEADLVVPVGTYHNDPDWQRRQFEAAAGATHVLIEAEEPPFGRLMARSVSAQTRALIDRGVDVAYLAHGTDARLPSRHAASSEWSYYRDPTVYLKRAEEVAARNIAILTSSGRRLFVSTPDLLLDLPQAEWCPVVVEPSRWAAKRSPRDANAPLRVVHAPSNPVLKGTPLIMPVLERLQREGVIDYRLIQGVPSEQMPGVFAEADVLLDQFRLGSYGVAACEAMAAGCAVIGQVSDEVRAIVADRSGLELPIIDATPKTLEQTLRDLAADPRLGTLSLRSTEFVRELHDGRASARILREAWLAAEEKEPARASHS